MRGQPRYNALTPHPVATKFPVNGCMDDLTTERSFDFRKLRVSEMCLAYLFDMLSTGVGTKRH